MSDNLDHAVIFSGDGEFRLLVEAVQRKGLRVSVVSTMHSQPPVIADELRRQADTFIELNDIREHIQRLPGKGAEDEAMPDVKFDPQVETA